MVGIAAAPDFTEELVRARLSPEQAEALARDGLFLAPSTYGDPVPITRRLLEDGADHLLLGGTIPCGSRSTSCTARRTRTCPGRRRSGSRAAGGRRRHGRAGEGRRPPLSREEDLRRIEAAVERVVAQAC
jgi:hypothetical protein